MQLIGMLDSPYVRRVAVTLLSARVAFEHRPISLFRHIDSFKTFSALLKAPTLVLDDGATLVESNVILDYLAAVHPSVAALSVARAPSPALAARADRGRAHRRRKGGAGALRARAAHARATQRRMDGARRRPVARRPRRARSRVAGERLDRAAKSWASPTSPSPAPGVFRKQRSAISSNCSTTATITGSPILPAAREDLRAFRAAPELDGVTAPIG